jgi:REP element-mobilizing transposase RayT
MSRKYKFHDPDSVYFITFSVVNWIDVFTRDAYRNILIDSFNYCMNEKGLVIHAWVIMTNHVHMVISRNGRNNLEHIMRDMKKYTSVQIIQTIENSTTESRKEWMMKLFENAGKRNSNNVKFQFWQQDNHPIELNVSKEIDQKIDYMHNNPVRAGFVNSAECYDWSSAMDYAGGKGLVKIEMV